jgi:death on curing protein
MSTLVPCGSAEVAFPEPARARSVTNPEPVLDGNKRTGLLAALVFLDLNGITIDHDSDALYDLTMGVAEGRLKKDAIAAELARIVSG